jgi:uncharacterized protein YhbP (UPF0306 family)
MSLPWLRTARDILRDVPTLSLATVDSSGGGTPHVANLNFIADEAMNLYWLSAPDSAHLLHIEKLPSVAATIYAPFLGPVTIKGLQIHGSSAVLPPERFDELWPRFCTKFPYAASMEQRARSQRFYILRPSWLRLIDNAVHFGFKAETAWPLA